MILHALNKVTLKQLNLTRQGHDATKTSLSCLSYTVHIIFSLVFGQKGPSEQRRLGTNCSAVKRSLVKVCTVCHSEAILYRKILELNKVLKCLKLLTLYTYHIDPKFLDRLV